MDYLKDYIFDIETYKHAFTFSIIRSDGMHKRTFEVSNRVNEVEKILFCLDYLKTNQCRLVGFNSIGFDYPIIHELIESRNKLPKTGTGLASKVFRWAQEQIDSFKDGFGNTVKTKDCHIPQVDLYRIHHFNNKAKSTGLKMLEFNMRLNNIEDLPFDIHQELSAEQIDKIKQYNEHDVACTLAFYKASLPQLKFRDELSAKLNHDFTNADDTKIGSEYFQMELEKAGVNLYKYQGGKRTMKQTPRDKITVKNCLFNYYKFNRPEFQAVYDWFSNQVLYETKGVFSDIEEHKLDGTAKYAEMNTKRVKFRTKPTDLEISTFKKEHPLGWVEEEELKATEYLFDSNGEHVMEYPLDSEGAIDFTKKQKKVRVPKKSYWGCYRTVDTLNVLVDGLRIDFGVGGVHASLVEKVVTSNTTYKLVDADVASMYPNLSIANRIHPEHLGEKFCDIYQDMYEQRKSFAKGTSENAMLKLALNGTYGKSNDKYSVFYDPEFTMSITLNGQLTLLMLVDMLMSIEGLKLVQLNTDGCTVALPRSREQDYFNICKEWEDVVKLNLEYVEYNKMFIRDVNNYIAVYTKGGIKRKGAYQYEDLGWHQNQSCLVVPKAAEACMVDGIDPEVFIRSHKDEFDFMLRTKVPRSSRLIMRYSDGTETKEQNICRYYPSLDGGKLIKIMPALEGKELDGERELSIDKEYNVRTCNNMSNFKWDVDYNYYIDGAKKLIIQNQKENK